MFCIKKFNLPYFDSGFSIILRADDNERLITCKSNSVLRMLDYQDLWDSSGRDIVSWVIEE